MKLARLNEAGRRCFM